MFTAYPTYSPYRTLKLSDPMMRGEDVYALQTGLRALVFDPGPLDGIFGRATRDATIAFQRAAGITADGLAGGGTQTALCRRLTDRTTKKYELPKGLEFGQVSHESSCRLGNYSPQRPDGSFDAGAAQRNSAYHALEDAFDPADSIDLLGRNTRSYYDKFTKVTGRRRRWELAAGAWNAPAYATWLAGASGGTKPGLTALAKLEAYIDSATALMVL